MICGVVKLVVSYFVCWFTKADHGATDGMGQDIPSRRSFFLECLFRSVRPHRDEQEISFVPFLFFGGGAGRGE